jgi:predicted phage terminase large subunit-like protein
MIISQLTKRFDLEQLQAEKARRKLWEYVKFIWPIVEPGTEFIDNWHIGALCEHLEAIHSGQIRNLLVTMPPRHMKSLCISVGFPTWEWISHPYEKYLFASYNGVLSTRDAVKSRRVLNSPKYRRYWGHLFQLTGDQNVKSRYENDHTGYRISTSVDGGATGDGGSRVIADDPHNMKEIFSETVRQAVLDWWDNVMSTRLNNPKRDARIVVMQRGHEEDLAGHIIEKGTYVHLNLPAEYEGDNRKTVIGWSDPRKDIDELLWPARFPRKELEAIKKDLGEYGTSAQLQQRPSPAEGGIIKTGRFKLIKELPDCHFIMQSYDTAFTEKTFNDPTAFMTFGVFYNAEESVEKNCVVILDGWEDHLDYPALRKRAMEEWHSEYGGDPARHVRTRKTDGVLIEEKGSGIALLQDLRLAGVPVVKYNPGRADKVSRAHQVAPTVDLGIIYVLESKKDPGKPVTWIRKALEDLKKFPNGKDDHYVDSFTQAIIYLRDARMFDLPTAKPDEPRTEDEVDYNERRKKHRNPYMC